jgi:NADPH:quinone reductase-like Zn-dependent oxidoreductase
VNYKTQNLLEEVKKHTQNHGADVVIDFFGQSHWHKNINSLAIDGRIVLLSTLSGKTVDGVDLDKLIRKRLAVYETSLRSRSIEYQADLIAGFRKNVPEKLTGSEGDGEVRTWIYKVFGWEQIREAHEEMESNANIGKIVVEVE